VNYGPGYPVYAGPPVRPGPRIAGTGVRVGAWLLDLLLLGLIGAVPGLFAILSGGVALNPAAMDQVSSNPGASPTVPYLVVNMGPLVIAAVVWVALAVAYGALSWAFYGGTPAQKALSLEVVDAATGKRLKIANAVFRSVLVNGVPAAAAAVVTVSMCQLLTVVIPASFHQSTGTSAYMDQAGIRGAWSGLLSASILIVWCWPLALLLTAASGRDKRGLHDRLAGSMVVVRLAVRWPVHPYAAPIGPIVAPPSWTPAGPFFGTPPARTTEPGTAPPSTPAGPAGDEEDADEPSPPGAQAPSPWPGLLPQEPPTQPWGVGLPTQVDRTADEAARDRERAAAGRQGPLGAKLPGGLRIVRFNRRLRAYTLDCLILLIVYLIISALAAGGAQNATPVSQREAMIAGLAGGAFQLAYFVLGWSLMRGSLGQKVFGLKVVSQSGGRLGVLDALARWAVLQGPFALSTAAPTGLASIVLLAAIVWGTFLAYATRDDPDGQGYHDRLARSLVVEES